MRPTSPPAEVRGIYLNSCPNCGGAIDEGRLRRGLPCFKCLPKIRRVSRRRLAEALEKHGTLGAMAEIEELERRAEELSRLFRELVGTPWGAQRSWIRRVVRGDSFSIMAPTGTGKTVFGLVTSVFFACRKDSGRYRALLLVPTTTLVRELTEKLEKFASKSGCQIRVLSYHGRAKRREEVLKEVLESNYDVLVVTIKFARTYAQQLSQHNFALVFVDDVDAVLKSNKSVRAVLKIVGLSEEDIRAGEELLSLQRKIAERRNSGEGVAEELYERRDSLRKRVAEAKARASQLIVSSATGRARGSASRLFRALLGFEVGGGSDIGLRNIVDAYLFAGDVFQEAVARVSELGDGTLVFVSKELGAEGADRLAEELRRNDVRAESYHSKSASERKLEDFKNGKVNVLVGVADYYGLLVRGIDLPRRVKHVVFVGVPKIVLRIGAERPSPINLMRLLSILMKSSVPQIAEEARRKLANLRKVTRRFSPAHLQSIAEKIERGEPEDSPLYKIIAETHSFVAEAMKRDEVWEDLSRRGDISVAEVDGQRYVKIADVATYVQGSGRSSRLYAGGITKGLSLVLVDDRRVFEDLRAKLSKLTRTEWSALSELDLSALLQEISEERKRMRRREGKVDLMKSVLLVVESPSKARTIASFFARPSMRIMPNGLRIHEVALPNHLLMVAASGGHVYDLALSVDVTGLPRPFSSYDNVFGVLVREKNKRAFVPVFAARKRCLSCGYQFASESSTCPRCGSRKVESSVQTIEDLRRAAWEVDEVLIGTDPDREGEKIGWDIFLALSPYARKIRRVEFHEVTREEILRSLASPREFNERLVEAQLVRRIEDRWIGFTLSPLLWCIFWPKYCSQTRISPGEAKLCQRKFNYNLSAGRVQTPVMGWVVKREEDREPVDLFLINSNGEPLISLREDAVERNVAAFLRRAWKRRKVIDVRISLASTRMEEVSPPPPYTTDALISDANRYLRMGAAETMRLAQDLFTWGLITYHRTDSTRVSERGMEIAREWFSEKFGERHRELMELRRWGEEGAHEAIRPVRPLDAESLMSYVQEGLIELPELTGRHLELYDMIFRRFMASQMRKAKVVRGSYLIEIAGGKGSVTTTEERVVEVGGAQEGDLSAGFTLVWKFGPKPKPLKTGELKARVRKRRIMKLPLMTQADIVEQMRDRGIGRPSTYSKILETLFKRGYVIAPKKRREYVVPTKRGKLALTFLTKDLKRKEMRSIELVGKHLKRVPSLVTEERTRDLERAMDEVEQNNKYWQAVVKELYKEIRGLSHPIRLLLSRNNLGGAGELSECLRGARNVFGEESREEQG